MVLTGNQKSPSKVLKTLNKLFIDGTGFFDAV